MGNCVSCTAARDEKSEVDEKKNGDISADAAAAKLAADNGDVIGDTDAAAKVGLTVNGEIGDVNNVQEESNNVKKTVDSSAIEVTLNDKPMDVDAAITNANEISDDLEHGQTQPHEEENVTDEVTENATGVNQRNFWTLSCLRF